MDEDSGLLYLHDMRCREFDAVVVAVDGMAVRLNHTAFYPGGGGLPPDRGVLACGGREIRVAGARRGGEEIWHDLETPSPPPGARVAGRLDWPHRYGVMRHHTAIHILCGVVYHLFAAVVTGGQVRSDRARLDLTLADLTRDRVQRIEDDANRVIQEARAIKVYSVPRTSLASMDLIRTRELRVPEGIREVRIVEIDGFDAQADGGTHVATTGECGRLRIVHTENKGRQNKRLEIALADAPAG